MSVLIGTLSGLDHVPSVFGKVAKVHRLGRARTLTSIYVPSCSAEILGGITLAVSYAFVAVIASEFLLAPAGIGHDIADSYMSFKIERMYGLMLALVILVIALNTLLRHLRVRIGAPAI
jgi:NitT/TauT family transport system permease protein